MRVIFMGTPDFAVPALTALIASKHEVVAAYCQPPRPAGRGMRITPSAVQQLAEAHGIPVHTPTSLKSAEAQAEFADHDADIAVVAAYGLLLPPAILAAPRLGCINIHPSDLPRWRGAAPLQRTLMAGDATTACCIMQMDAGLDTGAVLTREAYTIAEGMDYGALHDTMAALGAWQIIHVLDRIAADTPAPPMRQSTHGVTYAAKITKADRVMDWTQPAAMLLHQIRGLSPAPAAITQLNGETIKVFDATIAPGDAGQPPGAVLDNSLRINAGGGTALRITALQRPGRTRQSGAELLNSFLVSVGALAQNPPV